jgi:formylglycine-generating enzyme required for sulfatase activity
MGSSDGLPIAPEGPQHMVDVKEFWMADAPVRATQYEAVMNCNPSKLLGHPDLPVESVSWLDVKEFCDILRQASGVGIRLPSEAEWEYACRAFVAIPFRRFACGTELVRLV